MSRRPFGPADDDAPWDCDDADDGPPEPTLRDDVLRALTEAGFTPVRYWPDVLIPINPRLVRVGQPGAATGAVRVQWEGSSKATWLSHRERREAVAALRAAGLDAGAGGGVSVEVRGWLSDEERSAA